MTNTENYSSQMKKFSSQITLLVCIKRMRVMAHCRRNP